MSLQQGDRKGKSRKAKSERKEDRKKRKKEKEKKRKERDKRKRERKRKRKTKRSKEKEKEIYRHLPPQLPVSLFSLLLLAFPSRLRPFSFEHFSLSFTSFSIEKKSV